jgi:hypothetical protein
VILGKLCNIDPSRKLMPYQDTELSDYPSWKRLTTFRLK